ncbi:MAG TPA: hypothetical protein VGS27_29815 [Candidatus Sulfotelmatobacter sp.]|nr:hypothetical protein [Candidatus Sulfotelmatobacter sp.]
MLPRSILVAVLLVISIAFASPRNESTATGTPGLLYTVAKAYDPLAWLYGSDRFSPDATIFLAQGNITGPLVRNFAATADPAVSFDGQKVLFAGKSRAQDPWQIWELALGADLPRRVTQTKEDCIRPFYLPGDRIVYAHNVAGRLVVETSDLAGGNVLPLTYISSNAFPTDVLHDGRILFESGFPLGTDATPEIYTVYSDGSGIESYRCDHGAARHGSRQVSSGDIVFATAHGLQRFTSARAQQVSISAPAGEYAGDVVEAAAGDWIVAWRPSTSSQFQLVRWTAGSGELTPLLAQPAENVIQPTLIAQHAVPNRHPSGLHDWPNANLLCLNAYTSKYSFASASIHSVRFYARSSNGSTKLLGTAPVEQDGSFFVQVPNDQPLQLELLDANGKTLKRESGFFWMRRGEQRVCVGCHAGPETAPENAVPVVLLKSTTPADMTGSAQSAGGH